MIHLIAPATAVLGAVTAAVKLIQASERTIGVVECSRPAVVNGRTGFIVWDWMVLNEVYFAPDDPKARPQSFWTGTSNRRARREFDEAVRRYGV